MKTQLLNIVIAFLAICSLQAQPDTIWSRSYGGQYADGGRAVIEAIDDGYIITGYTYSYGYGYADIYLLKTDYDGNVIWTNDFGGANMEYAYDLCHSVEGDGYIIVGYTATFGPGSKDFYMIRTDLSGDGMWAKMFGGEGVEIAKSIVSTSDGNYLICGSRQDSISVEDDIYVVKVEPNGNLIWEKIFGSEHSEMGEDIIETSDGNILIAGSTGLYDIPGNNSGRNRDMYLLKIDQEGNFLHDGIYWVMEGNQGAYDDGYAVCENEYGEYYIVGGCSRESVEVMDIAVVKTDSDLNVIWKNNFEINESQFYDFAKVAVIQVSGGGILVCGSFKYAATLDNDLFLMKIDSAGNEEWSGYYGGDGSDAAYAIEQTQDGNFVMAGHTSSYGAGSFDVWLLKFDLETGVQNNFNIDKSDFKVYPNPGDSQITIKYKIESKIDVHISVMDSSGKIIRILKDNIQNEGEYRVKWDGKDNNGNDAPSGIYFCKLKLGAENMSKRIVKL